MASLITPNLIMPIPNKILLISFGYIYGMLTADYVFNVAKMIPSDHIPRYDLSGLSPVNINYIQKVFPDKVVTVAKCINLVMEAVQMDEIKRGIVIGVGCTYGQHRSVAVVEILSQKILDYQIVVKHRDIRGFVKEAGLVPHG